MSQAAEAVAGLARLLLMERRPSDALSEAEAILEHIETHPDLIGCREPHYVYMVSYQTLKANEDPRSREVPEADYKLLMKRAALIEDQATRRSFLEDVPVNRELQELWVQQQS